MVPYFGRHSKLLMTSKPIRFGFNVWRFHTLNGYLVKCMPYGGKFSNNDVFDLGLGDEVVLSLLLIVQEPSIHIFSNLFSSYKLCCLLRDNGFIATGTIRENQTCSSLPTIKIIKKIKFYDFLFDVKHEVLLVI